MPWTFPHIRGQIARFTKTRPGRVVGWWLVWLFALNVVWGFIRSRADNMGFPVTDGAALERSILGSLPEIEMQRQFHSISNSGTEWASVFIYMSWFIVPVLAALAVSFRRPDRINSFFMWWAAVFYVSLPVFILFPMEPPWMADPEVLKLATLAIGETSSSNPVAAMPSLHVALPVVLALWFTRERWRLPAALMFAYAGLISFEVVVSGEHYIMDVFGGVAAALVVVGLARALPRLKSIRMPRLRLSGQRARTSESGQALVEFALIFPFIIALLLVLIDGGFAIDRRIVLQHSVREGGRLASLAAAPAAVKTLTADQSQGLLDTTDVTICYVDTTGNGSVLDAGDSVRVSATYTYNFNGSGELIFNAFGVAAPSIDMTPHSQFVMNAPAPSGATAC